jgi:hypothetical protein
VRSHYDSSRSQLDRELQDVERRSLDTATLSLTLWERVRDVPTPLSAHTAQAWQMLRQLLSDKIVGRGR